MLFIILISNEMQHSLFYLETALHVSGGITTHPQERKTTVSTASGASHTVTGICR
jgi:hypothetical protein